jgi:hypothetical protein
MARGPESSPRWAILTVVKQHIVHMSPKIRMLQRIVDDGLVCGVSTGQSKTQRHDLVEEHVAL